MRRIGVVALLLALGAGLGAGAWAGDALEEVKKRGVLVVGVLDDAPPFAFFDRDSGRLVGYDVDFAEAVARRLGVRLEARAVNQGNRIAELLDGNVDVLAANLSHNEARDRVIALSEPYLVTGQKFLARRGTIRSMADLVGKKIGSVVGTPSEGCARDRCEGGTVVAFDDYVQAMDALRRGVIDAFSSDEAILVDLLASLPRGDYEVPELMISQQEYNLGVEKDDPALLAAVDQAIRDLQQTGEAKRIRDAWFGPPPELPPPAYGAVVRKAASRPRFLGVVLNGFLYPDTEVSIFALDGKEIGRGRIASVVGDEFYLDVEGPAYDFVRPGFLVAMNMTDEMALDILVRRQNLLQTVKSDAEKEAEEIQSRTYQEALEKDRQAQEMDRLREQNRMMIQRERNLYFRFRRGHRF